VVWYQFNQSSGTTVTDSSGNGRHGSLVNGPTWVTGQSGNAVNLDGSNDYVSMPTGVVNGLNNFSIATWVRLDTISTWSRIFDIGTGMTVNMFLTPQNGATNAVRFAITTNGNGSEQQISGSSALPTGTWTHVAVTKSGNTGTLYVNGSVVGTNNNMTLSPSSLGNTNQNWIGRSQYPDPYLDGQIDDFRIYNRALSGSEVSTLASGGGGPTPTPSPTPSGSWTLCANENQFCSFSGLKEVRYGANGQYAFQNHTDGVNCTNAVFGDPIPGTVKQCHYRDVTGPTPTPTPSASTTYQAENASVGGGSIVESNHTGYNGTGFVNFPASGGFVEFQNVNGGSGGSRTLQFRFALGAGGSRTGQLTVNGATQNITFNSTGAWNSWAVQNVMVTLNSGTNNTIRLQSTGQDLANQDQLTVN
jgi:hypothetical protein